MNHKQKRQLRVLIVIMLLLLSGALGAYFTYFSVREMRTVTITNVETERITNTQYLLTEENSDADFDMARLTVTNIQQNPELPTGCEITSLAIALNYYLPGTVDKLTLADNYLPKGEIGEVSPYGAFLGDPRDASSLGCYSTVILQTANAYFDENGYDNYTAYDLTGNALPNLYEEILAGNPVLIWSASGEATQEYVWEINGEQVTFTNNEHCRVLVGFDKAANTVTLCDPQSTENYVTVDATELAREYENLGRQAFVIHKIKEVH